MIFKWKKINKVKIHRLTPILRIILIEIFPKNNLLKLNYKMESKAQIFLTKVLKIKIKIISSANLMKLKFLFSKNKNIHNRIVKFKEYAKEW